MYCWAVQWKREEYNIYVYIRKFIYSYTIYVYDYMYYNYYRVSMILIHNINITPFDWVRVGIIN